MWLFLSSSIWPEWQLSSLYAPPPPPYPLNLHKSDQHNLHLPSQVPNQGIELPDEIKMRKELVVEDEEPVVEPVGDVEEEEADEDEAEAKQEQLHPRFVLKVVLMLLMLIINTIMIEDCLSWTITMIVVDWLGNDDKEMVI